MKRLLSLLLSLPVVCTFPLQGLWTLKGMPRPPSFQIEQDKIISSMSDGRVSITPKSVEFMPHNDTIMMVLQEPQVEQKPSDWYNVVKYSMFIHYFYKIQQHGMVVWVQLLDADQMQVSCSIGDEYWQSILDLTRTTNF